MKKNVIRLNESRLHKIVNESVKRILREAEEEYPYYVAADTESKYFMDYNKAFQYALKVAQESREQDPENWEEVHLMDNIKWESIVIFNESGIHDCENGTFQPWW